MRDDVGRPVEEAFVPRSPHRSRWRQHRRRAHRRPSAWFAGPYDSQIGGYGVVIDRGEAASTSMW